MKTCRKSLLFVVFLLIVGDILAVHSLFQINSDTVHVDIQYTIVLSFSVSDSDVSLTAVVRSSGRPVGAGIKVDFYYSLNGGNWTYFTTQQTNRGGVAHARYTIGGNGGYDFKAIVQYS